MRYRYALRKTRNIHSTIRYLRINRSWNAANLKQATHPRDLSMTREADWLIVRRVKRHSPPGRYFHKTRIANGIKKRRDRRKIQPRERRDNARKHYLPLPDFKPLSVNSPLLAARARKTRDERTKLSIIVASAEFSARSNLRPCAHYPITEIQS